MTKRRTPEDATLLDVLIDGFEKNELLEGFYWRQLPMPDERAAARKFDALTDEARRWKGPPTPERDSRLWRSARIPAPLRPRFRPQKGYAP